MAIISTQISTHNYDLPDPVSIKQDDEIIWSSDTGRVLSGLMTGDVVAHKRTFSIEWGVLDQDGIETIRTAFPAGFFQATIDGVTLNVYRSKISSDKIGILGSESNAKTWYRSCSVQLIER